MFLRTMLKDASTSIASDSSIPTAKITNENAIFSKEKSNLVILLPHSMWTTEMHGIFPLIVKGFATDRAMYFFHSITSYSFISPKFTVFHPLRS